LSRYWLFSVFVSVAAATLKVQEGCSREVLKDPFADPLSDVQNTSTSTCDWRIVWRY
jgi:hypothetical protein